MLEQKEWQNLEKCYLSFTEILLKKDGLVPILKLLHQMTGIETLYQDLQNNCWYIWSREKPEETRPQETFQNIHSEISRPLSLNGRLHGRLILLKKKAVGEYDEHVISYAMLTMKLWLQNQKDNREIEERHQDGFVQDLVLNNIRSYEEVIKRGHIYGWNLQEGYFTVLIVDIDDFKVQYEKIQNREESARIEQVNKDILEYSEKVISEHFPGLMTTKFIDLMGVILPHGEMTPALEKEIDAMCEKLRKEVKERFHFSLTIAIASTRDNIMDVHLSYQEAKKCVKISRILYRRNKVIRYSQLGIYRFLYSIRGNEEAESFYQEYIDMLLDYDHQHGTELMDTLIKIVLNGWNLKEAAEDMYVHYNTMKYRYRKIGELLNLDLEKYGEKLNLELAVKSYLLNHLDETAPEEYSW